MDRNQMRQEYRDLILEDKSQMERFKARCLRYLEEKTVADCFKLLPLFDIQKDFLKNNEDTEFHHLIKVFQIFEKYAASILAKPWCKDLHTIKVYTGFFKYNIERWLSSDIVCEVFKLIGYKRTSIDTLTLETRDYENRVVVIGFELFLAHTQLNILKSSEYLSPKYPMENILEGWLNTSGSVAKILDWLVTNSSTITKRSGFERSMSDTDISSETMRSKSVTIEGEPLVYDERGYTMVNRSVKYPPGHCASSGFTSLRTSDISDGQLYGDSDHTEPPPPPKSGSKSDHFDESAMVSKPLAFANKLHEHVQNKDINQTVNPEMMKDVVHLKGIVVARGGNLIRENSHLSEKSATCGTFIRAEKERVHQTLASRIAKGEETVRHTLQNKNSAPKKTEDYYSTPTEVYEEERKYENDSEHDCTVGMQPSCHRCGEPARFCCEVCDKIICQQCFDRTPKEDCCGNRYIFYSNV